MDSSRDIDRLSKEVVSQLAVIVRTSQLHDPRNVAVATSIEKFVAVANVIILEESSMDIEIVGEYFYLNGERVKFTMEHLLNFDFLQREFKKRALGSIKFSCAVSTSDMQEFLAAFTACQFQTEPFEDLLLKTDGMRCISVGRLRRISEQSDVDIRKTVKRTYFNAVSFTRGVMNKIKMGERISMKKAKRVVETMVDTLLDKEEFLFGMTVIKNYDEYTFHHSVNVSILSVALGQRLGLDKKSLMELGLVALFHDIGKTVIPNEILNKPTTFDEHDWKVMTRHPLFGVRLIFRMKNFDAASVHAAIVAYEHHIHPDGSGYPGVKPLPELDLFSRIVAIADQYDAMTSSRIYARTPMTPDKALALMVKRVSSQLDPLLMKFFINLVGTYPVGTLVMLDTLELAVVWAANQADNMRPRVKVITDSGGGRIEPWPADLTEKNAGGGFLRSIRKTVDHNRYGINLAEYFL